MGEILLISLPLKLPGSCSPPGQVLLLLALSSLQEACRSPHCITFRIKMVLWWSHKSSGDFNWYGNDKDRRRKVKFKFKLPSPDTQVDFLRS